MRCGIVREVPGLPPAAQQSRLLEAKDCDLIIREDEPTPEAQRRVRRAVLRLKAGDELLVTSLDVFQYSTGELARLIQHFLDVGVTLQIVGGSADVVTLPPTENVRKVLAMLAEHEARRPSRVPANAPSRTNGGSRNPLSKYQIEYARKLHKEGASLRSIGLLFQISPNEVWETIGPD